jgi:hypothetical protein
MTRFFEPSTTMLREELVENLNGAQAFVSYYLQDLNRTKGYQDRFLAAFPDDGASVASIVVKCIMNETNCSWNTAMLLWNERKIEFIMIYSTP